MTAKHLSHGLLAACALLLTANTAGADDRRLLSDAELDRVTAGTASVSETDERLLFEAVKKTASGRTITADGSLELVDALQGITIGNLTLADSAQQNLRSVVNINAVNSAVNVLLNLNVNIDSEVGSINQLNLNDTVPLPKATLPPSTGAP